MKKNILIVFTGAMELGGIERSLLGLLDVIDYKNYAVDLFLYGHRGELFEKINPNVNILPEINELAYLRESIKDKIRQGCYYSALLRIKDELLKPIKKIDYDATWNKVMQKKFLKINKKYDLAIGFFRPFDLIIDKVDATTKVGWIHTDYASEKVEKSVLLRDYCRLDYIVAVSEKCRECFCELFPQFESKVCVIENILSSKYIIDESKQLNLSNEIPEDGSIKLLSIGRFCEQKNFDNVPDICKRLIKAGMNVRWYLIGFGPDEGLIRNRIRETGMGDRVIILGKKSNPYPYIAACDVYVQPSRYEGKAVTVREAQILGKPVIITDYATAHSQLKNGYDGMIVPMDNEECANAMVKLLKNSTLLKQLSENAKQTDYSNSQEVEKIYRFLEEENED